MSAVDPKELQEQLLLLEAKLMSAQRMASTFDGHTSESLVAFIGDVVHELRAIRDRLSKPAE